MQITLIRSIPLSEETKQAWKNTAQVQENLTVKFMKRSNQEKLTQAGELSQLAQRGAIINLGSGRISTRFVSQENIAKKQAWNMAEWIQPLLTPAGTRALLEDLLPPIPTPDMLPAPVWIKPPGRGGRNKRLVTATTLPQVQDTWDIQLHITGLEYRVTTVGTTAVQCFRRTGPDAAREYHWVGTKDCPKAVRKTAKQAAAALHPNTIISWDIILDQSTNNAYILEGNSSPGINSNTGLRIIKELIKQQQEAHV